MNNSDPLPPLKNFTIEKPHRITYIRTPALCSGFKTITDRHGNPKQVPKIVGGKVPLATFVAILGTRNGTQLIKIGYSAFNSAKDKVVSKRFGKWVASQRAEKFSKNDPVLIIDGKYVTIFPQVIRDHPHEYIDFINECREKFKNVPFPKWALAEYNLAVVAAAELDRKAEKKAKREKEQAVKKEAKKEAQKAKREKAKAEKKDKNS